MNGSSSLPVEPLAGLNDEQQQRVCEILDDCFEALEAGEPVDRELLLEEHPDLADILPEYLRGLRFLQDAAAGFHPAPDADEATPKQIGDFRILREIGRGGMGIVYEAEQLSLGRIVALKVLPFASLLSSRQIARFRTEAQAAAKIEHPGIVPVFAIGNDRGLHYFAMQRIHGAPLDDVIHRLADGDSSSGNQVASPDRTCMAHEQLANLHREDIDGYCQRVAAIGADAARALQAAHDESIVHRDIKPSNLLLDQRGKIWVADFGLARCKDSQDLTGAHDVLGTLKYMSPEQANGSEWVDHRTDIYSLGVTLYELLTLHPAVAGDTPGAVADALQRRTPFRLRAWDPRIPRQWERVIRRAISKEPGERYSTAEAFATDLDSIAAGRPLSRERWTARMGRWTRRRHRGIAAALAVSTAVAVLLGVFSALLLSQRSRVNQALAAAQQSEQAYQVQLARADHQAAVLYLQTGKPDVGLRLMKQSASRLRDVLTDPQAASADANAGASAKASEQLVAVLHGLAVADTNASADVKLKWLREAAERHRAGRSSSRPLDAAWETKMAMLQTAIGDVEGDLGHWQRASIACDDAFQRWQTVAEHMPRSYEVAKSLATAWQRKADSHREAGTVGASSYQSILVDARDWLQSSPWSGELRSDPQLAVWLTNWKASAKPKTPTHSFPTRSQEAP